MADSPERERDKAVPSSRPLHNFTLPSRLKWGRQKHLRCLKSPQSSATATTNSDSSCNPTTSPADARSRQSKSPIPANRPSPISATPHTNIKAKTPITSIVMSASGGGTTEIEAVRERLMTDLKVAVDDHLKFKIFDEKQKLKNDKEKKPSEDELPWNLRNRRAAIKAANEGGNAGLSPMQQSERGLRSLAAADKGDFSGSAEQQRPKFSPTLTKEEIEADFLLMTGAKPPRRPKKRSRPVQKQLDGLFPGTWLTEVTPENYKVPDAPEPKAEK